MTMHREQTRITADPAEITVELAPLSELDHRTAAAPGTAAPWDAAEWALTGDPLSRLIGDADLASFWEREPFVARGLGSFDDVFSVDDVDELLTGGGLRVPALRLISAGSTIPEYRYLRPDHRPPGAVRHRPRPGVVRDGKPEGPKPVEGLIDPVRVNQLVAAGATLVLQGMRLYWRSVDRFSAHLGAQLGHPVHTNAYLTPMGASGAGAHWDMHSVFVRQVSGAKRWTVAEPVEPWPRNLSTKATAQGTRVVGDYVLEAGDCLYIPRGFIHDGWAVDDAPSAHITFGLHDPTTWADWFGELVHELADDPRLRQILPPRFAEHRDVVAESLAVSRDLVVEALQQMDVEGTALRIIEDSQHSDPDRAPGRLRALMTPLRPDTALRIADDRVVLATGAAESEPVTVTTSVGHLTAPAAFEGVLRRLLDGDEHTVGEFEREVDDDTARVLVERLVTVGAVTPV